MTELSNTIDMKVAIIHHWLIGMRGGEKVLESLCEMFPKAELFTHVYNPSAISDVIKKHRINTTFIQRLPGSRHYYKNYLPLMPLALEQLDLRGYDLVISIESGPAKGVIVPPNTLHICYCNTPMRYLWDLYHEYLKEGNKIKRLLLLPFVHYLRLWDFLSAARVDYFIANSEHVQKRIMKYYRRESEVIYPPVDTEAFAPSEERGDFYLMVGQLVRYKRPDLAVEAFNKTKKRLIVIGEGEQMSALKKAAGPTISFLGWQPFPVLRDHYARCRALIFPGEEDFGMVPVEGMASGRPVIAFKRGGALETVVEGETGIFFDHADVESLIEAINRYERIEEQFSSKVIIEQAKKFDQQHFKRKMEQTIGRMITKGI